MFRLFPTHKAVEFRTASGISCTVKNFLLCEIVINIQPTAATYYSVSSHCLALSFCLTMQIYDIYFIYATF